MRLPPEIRPFATVALTVVQCAAASYLIAKAENGFGVVFGLVCFVAPPVVFWLFMLELGDQERRFRDSR